MWIVLASAIAVSTTANASPPGYEPGEESGGGAATSRGPANHDAFSRPSGNMNFERQIDFKVGDGIFRKLWVSAPSSTRSSDGLGPYYNARSCQACHLKDGRGSPPAAGEAAVSLFLRLSVPPATDAERQALESLRQPLIPEPVYGGQLQTFAVQGLAAEGRMALAYREQPVALAGGAKASLRVPSYDAVDLAQGPMRADVMMSPRVAPPMIGMGLLEAIPEADILAGEDPDDRDGDGLSGRANRVWDDRAGAPRLGRFGWKAGQPDIAAQTVHAFAGDIGISTPQLPDPYGDCTAAQAACRGASHGGGADGIEVPQAMTGLVVFYARNLGVPIRRGADKPAVLAGKALFHQAGCARCHKPAFVTGQIPGLPELSDQAIRPYTDLLLHDMGEGLADHRPEGLADGREWRTPPLWGLGLTETVSGHDNLLHDGRARGLLEAILWHGGEAQGARDKVAAMAPKDRVRLLAFLRSL